MEPRLCPVTPICAAYEEEVGGFWARMVPTRATEPPIATMPPICKRHATGEDVAASNEGEMGSGKWGLRFPLWGGR